MRTTVQDVIDILGTNYDTLNCPKLHPYIKAASVIVDRVIECATERGITHTTEELIQIERWLAAHFYTIYDPIYKAKTTANSSATYFDRSYLDVAKMLDISGCLPGIIAGNRASFDWLGKVPSEQIDIDDRD